MSALASYSDRLEQERGSPEGRAPTCSTRRLSAWRSWRTPTKEIIRETHGQMHFAARAYRFFAGFADKIFGDTIPLDQRDFSETSYFVDD
ncbi:hypothetical protein [Bradyrhizobium sp. LB13.1]